MLLPTLRAAKTLPLLTILGACSSTVEPIPGSGGAGGTAGSGAVAGTGTGGIGGASGSGMAGSSVIAGGTGTAGLGGAAGSGGSGGGGTAGSSGSGGSGGAAVEASFATLKAMLPMSCYGGVCHDVPEHPLYLADGGKLYTTLLGHMVEGCGPVLKPGSPQDSALIKLLKGPCGGVDRMPLFACTADGDEACVKPEVIAALEKWISNGAPQ